jgi:YfiR/HmsC-like
MTKCQMLFVNTDKSDLLPKIIAKLKGKSTLVISEKEGAIKSGSIINFIIKDSKQKFELSVNNAEKSSLRVSKTLLPLAIEVN